MSNQLIPYEVYDANINGKDVKIIYLGKLVRFRSDQSVIVFRGEKNKIHCHRLRAYTCDNGKLKIDVSLERKISKSEEDFLDRLLTEKGA
ncbi:MAG TPA: hypothetical protein VJ142_00025 [Candidatus Nanoarchaeia archaeon]|nr:hypothetical protein [Candidatus Nanoarchaeia archaeon]